MAHPWRRLHPCKQVLIRRIDCCELRTSSIRSGRSASPAVAVGKSKQAICRTENNGNRMPGGAIASYSEQSYARSKALRCLSAERIESAGQRGTVLVLFRTCSRNLSAEQISRHKGSFKYFEICRVSKIPRDLLVCDKARHCMTAGSHSGAAHRGEQTYHFDFFADDVEGCWRTRGHASHSARSRGIGLGSCSRVPFRSFASLWELWRFRRRMVRSCIFFEVFGRG